MRLGQGQHVDGYLIATLATELQQREFLSPLCNKRTDEYSLGNRHGLKFFLEVIAKSREKAGKEGVTIPIMASVRINDPFLAERIIEAGKADLVAIGRALIADPEFVVKAEDERFDEIMPCIACNQGCFDMAFSGQPVYCLVNATVVIAIGDRPDNALYHQLEGRVSKLYLIGDGREVRKSAGAIREGFEVGCQI